MTTIAPLTSQYVLGLQLGVMIKFDGTIVLKYIPDDDSEDVEIPKPVVQELIQERCNSVL